MTETTLKPGNGLIPPGPGSKKGEHRHFYARTFSRMDRAMILAGIPLRCEHYLIQLKSLPETHHAGFGRRSTVQEKIFSATVPIKLYFNHLEELCGIMKEDWSIQ